MCCYCFIAFRFKKTSQISYLMDDTVRSAKTSALGVNGFEQYQTPGVLVEAQHRAWWHEFIKMCLTEGG